MPAIAQFNIQTSTCFSCFYVLCCFVRGVILRHWLLFGRVKPSNMEIVDESGTLVLEGRYTLTFGDSFGSKGDPHYFHTIRYDFKPASVEECTESYVEFAENNEVTVTIPKVDEAGEVQDATLYKGGKRLHQKEFLLLFNHDTKTFTLEKLTYNIQVKKTRGEIGAEALQAIRSTWSQLTSNRRQELEPDFNLENSKELSSSDEYISVSSVSSDRKEDDNDIAETLEAALSSTASAADDMPDLFADTPALFEPTEKVQPAFNQLHEDLQLSESSGEE
uniref:Ell-associated factor Eaf n=1 Tax=Trichuris muris TaxID=70415 RepID=A0A5S6QT93_TRIMR